MSKAQGNGRKALIIGVIAALVVLGALLAVLLTQCMGNAPAETTPSTTGDNAVETYEIYWNVDRKTYEGKSEAGMSSRTPESDGYFHVRFFKDGEIVTLKVVDRKTVNALEVRDLMGLEFNDEGIVVGIIPLEELPCEQVGWQFYVQSAGGKLIKANSSANLNGMEVMLECDENTGIWDMTGLSGEVGCVATPIPYDRLLAVANGAGQVTHVFLYERSNYMRTHEAECEHCGKVVQWSEWTRENAAPSITGHYKLMNDIKFPTNGSQVSLAEDQKICLDLNGKRIDGRDGSRVYSLHNPGTELAIMDTSEEKSGRIVAHGQGDQGMCVWLRYGVVYLYGGTLDASDASSIKNGTAVALQSNTYMYMYGGEIIGGTSKALKQENGKYTNGLGGTMAIANKGKFVMNDGIIRDGKAQAIITKRDAKGQPSTYERGHGGNIFMSSGAVMEINGGIIKNGTAGNQGGNIFMDGTAELTMTGGKIIGGKITGKGRNGGNVFVGGKSIFTMSGGSIENGSSRNCAGNLYLNGKVTMTGGKIVGGKIVDWNTGKVNASAASRNVFIVNGNFSMYGGSIDGGVQAIDTDATKTVTRVMLSGYATIEGKNAPNFTIATGGGGVEVRVGTLRDRAKIGVSTSVGLFSLPTAENNLDNFFSDVAGADVVYYQERLGLGRLSCQCGATTEAHIPGCSEELLFWAPWTATDKLPTTTGNYYLLKDVKCGQQNVAADAVINLDLNGHRVDGKNDSRIYSMHYRVETDNGDGTKTYEYPAKLTITDTSEGRKGVMASHGTANHQGSIAWLRYGDVTLLAGTFDASDYKGYSNWGAGKDGKFGTSDDTTTYIAGMAFAVDGGHTLTMYNGTVIGGETIAKEQTKTNTLPVPEGAPEGTEPATEEFTKTVGAGYGGAVSVNGNFYMYGGTIRDGLSGGTGGNIRISGGGKMYMYGGTIKNGTSTGNGGNFHIVSNGLLELHGGTIEGGWSKNVSGNIHLDGGKLVMDGGTITGGKSGSSGNANSETANVFSVNGKMDLSGGTITGRVRVANYNTDGAVNGSEVRISGNPVIAGGSVNMVLAPQDDKTGSKDDGKTPTMPIIRVVGPMTEGANIHVNPTTSGIDFAVGEGYNVTAEDAKAFTLQASDVKAAADTAANALFFGRYSCLCGKSEHTFGCKSVNGSEMLKWYAWSSKTTLPTTGNLYLVNDVDGSGSTTVKPGTTLNLDLNGKTVTWEYRAYRIYDANIVANATLTLTNTASTEGTIREEEITGVDQGCAVWLASGENGTFNLLDGVVLDGSKYTVKSVPSEKNGAGTTAEKNGGVVAVQSGVFNMYGGKIIGANAIRSEEITLTNGNKYSSYAPNGGAVALTSGTINMYSGEITGGRTANQGGNVLISGGKFNMSGGIISDGHAGNNAGNVFVHRSGELRMSGDARIENGVSDQNSGNINVDGKMSMTDNAVVTGGQAATGAGNLNVNYLISGGKEYFGTLTMDGKASVTDGVCGDQGGNIRVLQGTTLSIGGNATVSGGKALESDGSGGNIFVNGAGAKMTMNGNATVFGGEATYYGGNIYVYNGAEATISGDAIVTGGTVWGNGAGTEPTGGNLAVVTKDSKSTKVTIGGNAKIVDGISYHTAGNVRVSADCTVIIKDNVTISGGKITNSMGDTSKTPSENASSANIFSVNGALEIQGGNIAGNIQPISTRANGAIVKLSGNPVISKGASGYGIILSGSGAAAIPAQIVGAMTGEPGSVVIGINTGTGVVANGKDYTITDTDALVFTSDNKGNAADCYIYLNNNQLIVGKGECLCGQAEHTKACLDLWNGEERIWTAWTSTTALPTTSGNYYLTANVDFDWQQKNTANANVVIDLNGHTITNDNGQRIFSNWESGSSLTITDKSEKQDGKLIASGNAVDQGVIWARYGSFNLVAGTIDASGYNLKSVWNTTNNAVDEKNGGAVWVSGGATFNMYGGTIIGANLITSSTTVNGATQSIYAPKGGAICSEGTTNIYDGTIRDGKSEGECGNVYVRKGTFTMHGGKILDGAAGNAGNVIIHADGTMVLKEGALISGGEALTGAGGSMKVGGKLIIDGGQIKDGVSKGNGGNIHIVSTGTVELKSGTVSGGWGKNVTGNIHVDGGKLIMTGGEIKGGKVGSAADATKTDANINNVRGKLELLGGTVDGGILIQNYNGVGATAKLGGNVVINKFVQITHTDGYAQPQLEIASDYTGSVKVYTKSEGIITTNAVTEAQAKQITTSNTGKGIYRITDNMGFPAEDVGKLYLGQIHCVCGASKTGGTHYADICDGTMHIWQPTTSIVDSDGLGADQYYYFVSDVTASTTQLWGSEHNVTYDMNGFNLKNTGGRVLTTYSSTGDCKLPMTFTIVNTGTTGTITVSGAGDEGRIAWLRGTKKTVNIYNVDINISAATGKSSHTVKKDGMAFSAAGWSNNVNLYKVNVVGGTSASDGNFMGLPGKLNKAVIKDSTITGCSTAQTEKDFGGNGGALWVGPEAQLTLHNTKVTGNIAKNNGGGVYVSAKGKLIVSGSTKITGNTVDGAENNVYLEEGAILETGTLGSDAQVGLGGVTDKVLSTDVTYAEMKQVFRADSGEQQLTHNDSGLSLADASAHIHCVCGGTIASGTKLPDGTYHYCKDIVYTAMNKTYGAVTGNTNWYLKDNVTLTGQLGSAEHTLNLCLNGHNIDQNFNARMIRTYADKKTNGRITLTSCAPDKVVDGKIINNTIIKKGGTFSNDTDGGIFWITSSGTVEMYAGNLDASGLTLQPNSDDKAKHGCAVLVEAGSTFKLYGGTITGGKTKKGTNHNSEGACIFSSGTIVMNGGKIVGGETVGSGGSLFLFTNSVTKIYGGTITGGKAGNNGGNIHYEGKELLIAGGTIEKGTATNARGGNVWFCADGGTISGGTISGGQSKDGGNIALNSNKTLIMTGGTITDGNCTSAGGNAWLMGTLKMSGGLIEKGTKGGNLHHTGANMNMNGTGALEMSGGTIKGRVCTAVAGAKVKLSDSAKIYETDTTNNLYVWGFNITVDKLNDDAKIGLLILNENQIGNVATVAEGVTLNLAQIPVNDVGLPNGGSRTFAAQQDGTTLKIVETTK